MVQKSIESKNDSQISQITTVNISRHNSRHLTTHMYKYIVCNIEYVLFYINDYTPSGVCLFVCFVYLTFSSFNGI